MWSPNVEVSRTFITFWIAFFITEYDKPLEISPTVYPSFWACFILEFMNTVHLDPKSTGLLASIASFTNSFMSNFKLLANVSIKEPQPEEHASFNMILSIASFFIFMYFISWPPMSIIAVTSGSNCLAAV